MRNRILGCLVITTCLALNAKAEAQDSFQLLLGGGAAIPVVPSAFTDFWNTGFNVDGTLQFKVAPEVALTAGFDVGRFGFSGLGLPYASTDGGATTISFASVGMKLYPLAKTGSVVQLYLGFGAGFYRLNIADMSVRVGSQFSQVTSTPDNAFGVHTVAGIQTNDFFIEASYLVGFTQGGATGYLPLRIGVILNLGP